MNLFVDSNIFLDFYHFSSDDLDELTKLTDLIKKGEIKLYIPIQIIKEVNRNRDSKVADGYKKFSKSKIEQKIPQICKTYPQYKDMKKAIKSLKKAKSELDQELQKDIINKTLKADKIIKELFDLAIIIDSNKYLNEADIRIKTGNPPGKKKSLGDALNWESLLDQLPNNEDLFFISDDIDFKSPLDENLFDSYLLKEWEDKKDSKIFFYTQLSLFFNKHHKEIKLRKEEEKNKLINNLFHSPNFANTHYCISQLSDYNDFSDHQIRLLIHAAITNSQILSIAQDEDVNEFFHNIIQGREDVIKTITYDEFTKYYAKVDYQNYYDEIIST